MINLRLPDRFGPPAADLWAFGSSDGEGAASVSLRAARAGLGAFLAGGFDDAPHGVGGASRRLWAATAKLSALRGDGGEAASGFLRVSQGWFRAFPDDSGGPDLAARRTLEAREVRDLVGGARGQWPLSARVSVRLAVGGVARREADLSPGVAPGLRDPAGLPASDTVTDFGRVRDEASLEWRPGGGAGLLGGVQLQQEAGTTSGHLTFFGQHLPAAFDLRRRTASVFGEGFAQAGAWRAEGGVRYDAVQGLNGRATGRVGVSRRPVGDGWSLEASVGSGFKAPSFYALGNPLVGNAALRPETSLGWEVLAGLKLAGGSVEGGAFGARCHDLVDFDPGPPPRLVDRSSVTSNGALVRVETPAAWAARLTGGLTYAQVRDADTGLPLRGRPRWRGALDLRVTPSGPLSYRVGVILVGSRLDSSVPTGDVVLPAYGSVTAGATWTVRQGARLTLDVTNLLNARYQERVGFPAPGRAARLSLDAAF